MRNAALGNLASKAEDRLLGRGARWITDCSFGPDVAPAALAVEPIGTLAIAASPPPSLVPIVRSAADGDEDRVASIAEQFSLPIEDNSAIPPTSPRLRFVENELSLEWTPDESRAPIRSAIDFSSERRHVRGHGGDLARALGSVPRTVLDATAGWGRDAYHLAQLGYRVIAYERHPAIAALLADAHRRAREDEEIADVVSERLEFRFGDARDACRDVTAETVYLDPMFPPARRPKALPKKELQLLRAVVPYASSAEDSGESHEGEATIGGELGELIDLARRAAGDRVVLKRPHHVAPHPGARHRYRTKLVCYDVFGSA